MDEPKDQDLIDLNEIDDDQERLHFQLSSKWDKERLYPQKVKEQFYELKKLQLLLYFLITSGIVSFFILISINIHPIIIIIDVGVVVVYIFYLKYITHIYRKKLKITKKDYRYFSLIKKKRDNQLIFTSFIIIVTLIILIISMIGIDPLILIIIFGVSLLYIYFDIDVEDDSTSSFKL